MLALVATGRTNRDIADRLVISEETVASHLSHIFPKRGLSSRAAATAYAHEHGLVPENDQRSSWITTGATRTVRRRP